MGEAQEFEQRLKEVADRVTVALDQLIPPAGGPEANLMRAMRHAALANGKRMRPFFLLETGAMFDAPEKTLLRAAAALECVHCYSLVHDDLPCMDDDDFRRGQPTVHKAFDEATAVLAGDALLTLAFKILASTETHDDASVRAMLIERLADASGARGMVGGQMLDLVAEDHELNMPEVTRLQRMKTGALIAVSCEAGAILGKASENAHHVLHAYAHDVGLAFQIADDLLDVEGDEKEVGKKTGKDVAAGKATFVSLMGAERAREQAQLLADQAAQHLKIFSEKGKLLKELAHFVVNRRA